MITFDPPKASASIKKIKASATVNVTVGGSIKPKPLSVTENGVYTAPEGESYTPVEVNVPPPTGTIEITQNGTHDVTDYAEAEVSVKTWDAELAEIVEGTATELRNLPVTKIKPYAFYFPYAQLEYAQSTGTQYLLANFSYNAAKAYKVIIDVQAVGQNDLVGFGWNAGGGLYFRNNKYGNGLTSGTTDIDGSVRVVATIDIGTNGTTDYVFADTNGNVLASNSRSNTSLGSWAGSINYPLFGTNSNPATLPSLFFKGKLFSFKAFVDGVLTSDFIPVLHNGTVKFLNKVDGVFYTNAGTGSFTGGGVAPSTFDSTIESADLSVTEIGDYAFYNNALQTLTLRADSVCSLGEHALDGTPIASGTGHIYVPAALVDSYKAAWSDYAAVIEAIGG